MNDSLIISPTVETKDSRKQVVLTCGLEGNIGCDDAIYDATWATDNNEAIKHEAIESSQIPAKLYEDDWKKFNLMGENVKEISLKNHSYMLFCIGHK